MNRLLNLFSPSALSTSPERRPAFSLAKTVLAACPTMLMLCGISQAQTPTTPSITLAVTSAAGAVSTVAAGTPVTLTVTVPSAGKFLQTGIVRICDLSIAPRCTNENKLGNAQLTKAGMATYKFIPSPGKHSFSAVFLQQWHFNTVTSAAAALTVSTVGTSTTTLTQAGTVGAYTLTAKVATAGLPGVAPTGSVNFLDTSANNLQIGTAPLVAAVGSGALSFTSSVVTQSATAVNPSSVAVGDFNGDGKQDMAIVASDSTSITMMYGNGDGTFTQGASVGNFYQGVVQIKSADFNQDGIADLALVDLTNSVIHIFLGKGDGTFTQAADAIGMNGTAAITITDFNKDGIPDMIVANRYSDTVSFLAGKGDGTFTSGWDSYVSWQNPTFVLAGDFNNDGNQDFVVNILNGAGFAIYMGNGDGTFAAPVYYTAGNGPASITAGDFNGDGFTDLAVANTQDNTVTVFLGKGDGTFTTKGTFATPANLNSVASADFNGDSKLDLVISTGSGNTLVYFYGNGDGTFTQGASVVAKNPTGLAIADFNNDGVADVATGNVGQAATTVVTNLVQSTTATLTGLSVPGTGTHLVTAKYVGDLNFGTSTSAAQSLTAKTTPTSMMLYTSTWVSTYGQQVALTANLSPYSVAPASSNGETVTFYMDGNVIGTAKLNSGSATLNTTSLPVGFHLLGVVYSGDSTLNASVGYNFIMVNNASTGWPWWF